MPVAQHGSSRLWGTWGLALLLGCAGAGASAAAPAPVGAAVRTQGATLTPFASEADLQRYLKRRAEWAKTHPTRHRAAEGEMDMVASAAPSPPAAQAATTAGTTSITNVQEQGVDEGDIVKVRGDILVILRRGRLFTVSLAHGGMRPVDSVNAYAPNVNAGSDWYDEMLIAGDRVIVIGYSYGRGGTEINRFRIDDRGRLKYEDTYQLRSNDYYSSRNYASRLIGHKLIVYAPLYLPWDENPMASFPALRRWSGDANGKFQRIVSAQHIYYSPRLENGQVQAIHTVTSCDLTAPVLDCDATTVFGPAGRTFYVSSHAVYVWVTAWWWGDVPEDAKSPSMLYRLPLDGSAPSAIGVSGSPVDQFSFREDASDGVVNVLVRSEGGGDAMWLPEHTRGAVALLRLPLGAFGDGTRDAGLRRYRVLPTPGGGGYDFHNRFVGDYVLYGNGNGWGRPQNQDSALVAAPVRGGAVTQLPFPHGVDRIEVMGRDAVVVGSDRQNVYFSAVELVPGRAPTEGDRYTLEGAAQAETRSHGFFFKPESMDGAYGVLGLPVARPATPAYRHLFDTSAAIVFLRRTNGRFGNLGELDAHSEGSVDDHCVASCVDWYGNARPIFMGNRTFALMGYELVEGRLGERRIRETGRVSFAPEGRHSERSTP